MAGAFSGLLAYGIVRMDGVAGYEGWRWVRCLSQMMQSNRLHLCVDLYPRRSSFGSRWNRLFLAADRLAETLLQVARSRRDPLSGTASNRSRPSEAPRNEEREELRYEDHSQRAMRLEDLPLNHRILVECHA